MYVQGKEEEGRDGGTEQIDIPEFPGNSFAFGKDAVVIEHRFQGGGRRNKKTPFPPSPDWKQRRGRRRRRNHRDSMPAQSL